MACKWICLIMFNSVYHKTCKTYKTMNKFDKRVTTAQPCVAGKLPVGKFSHASINRSFGCFVGFVLFLMLMSGCQMESKLAKTFVEAQKDTQVAVYFPEEATVKVEYNTQYGMKTEVLNGFSQDLFLDVMYEAYADMLRTYGLNVYIPEDPDNVQVDSTHWLVMLSQMEISGRITEYEDYLFSDADQYSYKFPLNTVNVASWFEINDGEWRPIQFCEHNLMDGFESKTDYSLWSNRVDYSYTIDTLKLNDVYNYAVYLGKLYAGYTYDYMMNSYVGEELKKQNYAYQLLLRYDPYKKQVRYADEDESFIEIAE